MKIYKIILNWRKTGWQDCGGPYATKEKAEEILDKILKRNHGGNPDAEHKIIEEEVIE